MKKIVLLGSTGTIGENTLHVVRNRREDFTVAGLACLTRRARLHEQIAEFHPRFAWFGRHTAEDCRRFPGTTFSSDPQFLTAMVTDRDVDVVVAAIPGIVSLDAVMGALVAGKTIALATKEIMVVAGDRVTAAARKHGGKILPVDSEHNAIFQMLERVPRREVRKVWLTASGGPFLRRKNVRNVTVQDVLSHPVWRMGKKVTVDSATMMNKGFEIIEAHHLFSLPEEKIGVLIHPEAVVHGLVEFTNGVMEALLSPPDMKFAINVALHYPRRTSHSWGTLSLPEIGSLTFEHPRADAPWLRLARAAIREKGTFPVVLNGANDEAVSLFLKEQIGFASIIPLVEETLEARRPAAVVSPEEIPVLDDWAHRAAREIARKKFQR